MNLEQLKRNLVNYAGFKPTNNQKLKIIENSFLNSAAMYFRAVEKDIHGKPIFSKNIAENQKESVILNELKEMKQVSQNFRINELVVNFMSKAHNDWIVEHKHELQNNNMKNPEKFVPIELLTTKEINEYMSVLTPIFKSLEISFDEKEVRKAFARRQLVFMIKNEIFSDENLEEKLRNINVLNPDILDVNISDEPTILELLEKEDVAKNIAEHVKPRKNLDIADKFKEVLKQNSNVGYFTVDKVQKKKNVYRFSESISQKKIGFKKHALPKLEKPITKAVHYLARSGGVIFAKNVKTSDYKYFDYYNNAYKFVEYKDCSDEQKRAIDRRQRKLEKLSKNINYNLDSDHLGVISMVIVKKDLKLPSQQYLKDKDKYYKRETEVIQIPITQRELLDMNILPEEVGWEKEKKARITSSSKSFFASNIKKLQESNEFKDSLLVNISRNIDETKPNMESKRKESKEEKENNKNER